MDCSKVRLNINKAMPLWSLELLPWEWNSCYRTNASFPFLALQDQHAFKFAFLWRSIQILLGRVKTQTLENFTHCLPVNHTHSVCNASYAYRLGIKI